MLDRGAEYRLRREPRHPTSRCRRNHRCPPVARRRRSRRRPGHAGTEGAARPDVGPDPAHRAPLGNALPGARFAGRRRRPPLLRDPRRGDRRLRADAQRQSAAPGEPARHPVRADPVDDPARRLPRRRRHRSVGRPRSARRARVQRRSIGDPLVCRVSRRLPRRRDRRRADRQRPAAASDRVHEHDARAQHRRRRDDRVHPPGALREAARRRPRVTPRRAGEGRDPAPEHPAALDRRPAEGGHPPDRRPVQLGHDPLRRRRRLHADVRAPGAGRGRRAPRPPVQPLRHAGGALRAREDQDHRRLLHGRRGCPGGPPRPRPGGRPDGARHARGDAVERRRRASRAGAPGRHQLGSGRRRRHRPKAIPVRPVGRRGEHRQPDGVARHAGPDPDHPGDPRAPRRRVRDRAARHDPGQGQGRDGGLVSRRPADRATFRSVAPSRRLRPPSPVRPRPRGRNARTSGSSRPSDGSRSSSASCRRSGGPTPCAPT